MKKIIIFMILLISLLSITACGTDDENSTEAETSTVEENIETEVLESKIAETSNTTKETENSKEDNFWDFLYEDIAEFEFELQSNGSSYVLVDYNYLSLDATKDVIIPSTYEGLPVTEIKSEAFMLVTLLKMLLFLIVYIK